MNLNDEPDKNSTPEQIREWLISRMDPEEHSRKVEAWARDYAQQKREFFPVVCVTTVGKRSGKNGQHNMYVVLPWETCGHEEVVSILKQFGHMCHAEKQFPLCITLCTTGATVDADVVEDNGEISLEKLQELVEKIDSRQKGEELPACVGRPVIITATAVIDHRCFVREISCTFDPDTDQIQWGDDEEVISRDSPGPLSSFYVAWQDAVKGRNKEDAGTYHTVDMNPDGSKQVMQMFRPGTTEFERKTSWNMN